MILYMPNYYSDILSVRFMIQNRTWGGGVAGGGTGMAQIVEVFFLQEERKSITGGEEVVTHD